MGSGGGKERVRPTTEERALQRAQKAVSCAEARLQAALDYKNKHITLNSTQGAITQNAKRIETAQANLEKQQAALAELQSPADNDVGVPGSNMVIGVEGIGSENISEDGLDEYILPNDNRDDVTDEAKLRKPWFWEAAYWRRQKPANDGDPVGSITISVSPMLDNDGKEEAEESASPTDDGPILSGSNRPTRSSSFSGSSSSRLNVETLARSRSFSDVSDIRDVRRASVVMAEPLVSQPKRPYWWQRAWQSLWGKKSANDDTYESPAPVVDDTGLEPVSPLDDDEEKSNAYAAFYAAFYEVKSLFLGRTPEELEESEEFDEPLASYPKEERSYQTLASNALSLVGEQLAPIGQAFSRLYGMLPSWPKKKEDFESESELMDAPVAKTYDCPELSNYNRSLYEMGTNESTEKLAKALAQRFLNGYDNDDVSVKQLHPRDDSKKAVEYTWQKKGQAAKCVMTQKPSGETQVSVSGNQEDKVFENLIRLIKQAHPPARSGAGLQRIQLIPSQCQFTDAQFNKFIKACAANGIEIAGVSEKTSEAGQHYNQLLTAAVSRRAVEPPPSRRSSTPLHGAAADSLGIVSDDDDELSL